MKYPDFIKKEDLIATTAPSAGITQIEKLLRIDNAIKNIRKLGYNFKETKSVRNNLNGRSNTAKKRAEEFMELWSDDNVKSIIMAAGRRFFIRNIRIFRF